MSIKSKWENNVRRKSFEMKIQKFLKKRFIYRGAWSVQSVKHLPYALVMIPGFCDGTPQPAPCSRGSLLLSPSLPLPLLMLSLSQVNK